MSKEPLPSLAADLAPRRRIDLKAIRPNLVDDAEVAENSRRIGEDWGAQTSLAPAPEPVLDAAKAEPEREPARKPVKVAAERVPMASLRIEVPDYLDRDLAMEAVKQRCTKQYLVMKALRNAGYRVDDAHMMEDGRKAKRKA